MKVMNVIVYVLLVCLFAPVAQVMAQTTPSVEPSGAISNAAVAVRDYSVDTALDLDQYLRENFENAEYFHAGKNFVATVLVDATVFRALGRAYETVESKADRLALLERKLAEQRGILTVGDIEDQIKALRSQADAYEPAMVDGKPIIRETQAYLKKVALLRAKQETAMPDGQRSTNIWRITQEIEHTKTSIIRKFKVGGLHAKNAFALAGRIFLLVDMMTAGYVLFVLEKDPEVMPVVSIIADRSGGTELTEEGVKALQQQINKAVGVNRRQ